MTITTTVDVPATATLMVDVDAPSQEPRPATAEDLASFGYVDRIKTYGRVADELCEFLGVKGTDDFTEIGMMLRYVIECAVTGYGHKAYDPSIPNAVSSDEMRFYYWTEPDDPDSEDAWAEERRIGFLVAHLRQMLTKPMDDRRWPDPLVGIQVPRIPTGA